MVDQCHGYHFTSRPIPARSPPILLGDLFHRWHIPLVDLFSRETYFRGSTPSTRRPISPIDPFHPVTHSTRRPISPGDPFHTVTHFTSRPIPPGNPFLLETNPKQERPDPPPMVTRSIHGDTHIHKFHPVNVSHFPGSPPCSRRLAKVRVVHGVGSGSAAMVTPVGAQEAQWSQQAGPVQVGVQGLPVQHARGVGRGEGAEGPGGRGHRGAVDVQPGVLLLPLGAAVLEPDLHLRLRQVQRQRQVEPLAHGQVAGGLELVLQGHQLLVRERCPGPSRLPVFICAPASSSSSSAASSSASLAV